MDIIFDLDGTLVDSSSGILQAIDDAFKHCNVTMKLPLTSTLIGPPLNELIVMLSGTVDRETLAAISAAFKDNYDSAGYKITTAFDGVNELLDHLYKAGHTLYLATNKRIIPTRKIIEYFSWGKYFEEVYALDLFSHTDSKKDLIAHIINIHQLDTSNTVYIGDTLADSVATRANGIYYIMAMWGYDSEMFLDGEIAYTPAAIIDCINKIGGV